MINQGSIVAVVGAGTMGRGVALVAATAGHDVLLYDADPGAAGRAADRLASDLAARVERGKLSATERDARLRRIRAVATVAELASARLVIEAIVEELEAKITLFRQLEFVVSDTTILATNTSSLSVTALSARLQRPGRMVGLHFFNPAPIMPLVEIISGRLTDREVAKTVFETAQAWGKMPVHCTSTPGFIVNRVARPYYGEALRLLTEGAADPATLDAVFRDCGGFRMGPFELMDLIGHDVNFAVTSSVYDAMFHDPRYTPSLVQRDLVDAGLLGRKSGTGFYDYSANAARPAPAPADAEPKALPAEVWVAGNLGPAAALLQVAQQAGIAVERREELYNALIVDGTLVMLSDGRIATAISRQVDRPVVVFDLALDYAATPRIALAGSDDIHAADLDSAVGFFQALGKRVTILDDVPGLAVMRTVAMLANEAADAVHQRVASAADVDLSMRKGVNYPMGPLAWADQIGASQVASVVDALAQYYGEDRYRLSPFLRRRALRSTPLLSE